MRGLPRIVTAEPVAPTLQPADLKRRLDRGEPVVVVDVRDPDEFGAWHIPGAVNVPVDRIEAGDPVPARPGTDVVTVCLHGARSARARDALASRGLRASSLEGGMVGWNSVYDEARLVTDREGVEIVQFRRVGKGCLSYLVASDGEAAVIDPTLDADVFLDAADARGVRVSIVIDTHAHADHASGARTILRRTGARYLAPDEAGSHLPRSAPLEGMPVRVGRAELVPVATPGHTPGSTCWRLGDVLFTGDTLFVEGVGRPDLGQDARANALRLWDSLHGRLLPLPPATRVLPAHYGDAVPLVPGRPIEAGIGDLARRLPALAMAREAFAEWVAQSESPKPPNFEVLKKVNVGLIALDDLDEVRDLEAGPNRCAVKG